MMHSNNYETSIHQTSKILNFHQKTLFMWSCSRETILVGQYRHKPTSHFHHMILRIIYIKTHRSNQWKHIRSFKIYDLFISTETATLSRKLGPEKENVAYHRLNVLLRSDREIITISQKINWVDGTSRKIGFAVWNLEEKCRNYGIVSLFSVSNTNKLIQRQGDLQFRMLLSEEGWNLLGFVW